MQENIIDKEVVVLEGLQDRRRTSVFPTSLLNRKSVKFPEGRLRADKTGIWLCLYGSKRFSGVTAGRRRLTTKVTQLGSIDQIHSFDIDKDAQKMGEGRWTLEMENGHGGVFKYVFRSASLFGALGWIQMLRKLTGQKPVTVVAVLGETGVGKSLICSKIAGLKPENEVFKVNCTVESVTTHTDMYFTTWFGRVEEDPVVVIDTPGLNDSQGRDNIHISEMLTKLADLGAVNTFLILFNSEDPRLRGPLEKMLKLFEQKFGKTFWQHAIMVFSRWYMDKASQRRRKQTKESLAAEWNEALQKRFPSILEMRRRDKSLLAFFVDSEVDTDDQAASEAVEEEFDRLSVLARQNLEFDCRDALPDDKEVLGGTFDIPEEAEALGNILRAKRLLHRLPFLVENGVKTYEELEKIRGKDLKLIFGWTDEEVERLRTPPPPEHLSPNYIVVNEFEQLGINTSELAKLELGAQEVLKIPDIEQVQERLRITAFSQLMAFREWRSRTLNGTVVTADMLWEEDVVTRSDIGWVYDAMSRPKQHDQNGPGLVLNWRDMDGNVHGITTSPPGWKGNPTTFDVPPLKGWARVYWYASGYSNTYRVGAEGKCDLKFCLAEDHGIENPEASKRNMGDFVPRDDASQLTPSELRCTFGYPMGIPVSHWSKFDVRPNVTKAFCGLVNGDVVHVGDISAVFIGLKADMKENKVKPYFHVLQGRKAYGAGQFEESTVYTRTSHQNVREYDYDDMDTHSDDGIDNCSLAELDTRLQEDFPYPIGNRIGQPCKFDIRDEIIGAFHEGLRSGEELQLRLQGRETTFHVVGVSRHESEVPRLWLHQAGHAGATIMENLHEDIPKCIGPTRIPTLFERTGNRRTLQPLEIDEVNRFKCPPEPVLRKMKLSLTYEFPRGRLGTMSKFDVSAASCMKLSGHRSGTVLEPISGNSSPLIVIGVLQNPENDLPTIWFYEEGDRGAMIVPQFYELSWAFTPREELADLDALKEQIANMPASQAGEGVFGLLRLMQALANGRQDDEDEEEDFAAFLRRMEDQ